ncbi:hypothetical protein D187_006775 [Cystobacter fuscus DSM 2262]|uniref:Uncharacterized protein n=1 Tax=Cystobacter fuscus (strain ATCC 25194 / DSM 2262 / NBRC 100088 / M29) TaxID=1242864 RepID=S9P1M4_CYSF2|nr:hypothetical protein [Cystobacter fuscus]EPX57021.1 hypothetical protein D187_006775 [Cystobacter fuscus DSM 2262]
MTLDEHGEIRDSAPELFFRETMSGGLSLGTTDPRQGAARGRRTPFTFHATILVDDVEAFLENPQHTARLLARASYAPLGQELLVERGRFNLFRPADAPGSRLMTYGLPFVSGARAYYLSGTKTVRDDQGWDLWRDTTRLSCRLHEGEDERGPIVGAGVLSLGLRDVLAIMASMGSRLPEPMGLQVRLRFGEFFLGSLWRLYAPKVLALRNAGRPSIPFPPRLESP